MYTIFEIFVEKRVFFVKFTIFVLLKKPFPKKNKRLSYKNYVLNKNHFALLIRLDQLVEQYARRVA